uniref:Sm domain-containing protein n=2 Tax=Ditylum brightwellii TaxID=49249 RepID=A0A6V2LEV8_9STRA
MSTIATTDNTATDATKTDQTNTAATQKRSPSDFLKAVLGRPVNVRLNSGTDYRGVLACLDGYMNIAMEQTEEYEDGQLKAKYGDVFIRGNNGMYFVEYAPKHKVWRKEGIVFKKCLTLLMILTFCVFFSFLCLHTHMYFYLQSCIFQHRREGSFMEYIYMFSAIKKAFQDVVTKSLHMHIV